MLKQGFIQRTDSEGAARNYVESTLVSIGDTQLTLNNDKQTPYHIATIQFVTAKGELKAATAQIWAVNVDKVTVGQNYLTEVRRDGDNIYMVLTPLNSAARAEVDDFDFSASAASVGTAQQVGAINA